MTVPVSPTPRPAISPFPAKGDPDFDQKAFDWAEEQPGVADWMESTAENVETNAQISHDNAETAVLASGNAASAAEVAMGATNFKGMWSALAALPNPADRVLNKPATVKQNGRFWLLLTNLADVAASEPSTSNPHWTTLDSGVEITQQITTSTTAIAGVTYILTAPSVTLTGPAAGSLAKGEGWGYVLTAAARTCFINFANVPYRKRATGAVAWTIDSDVSGKWFQYEDTTQGYI